MIPFVDLQAQYRSIKPEIDQAVARVLESSQFVLGPEVAAFEQEFAAYSRVKHAIAVNSGTSALHLALLAAEVRPGDEVITVPFTFVATAAAILYARAQPVYVDIDPETFTMDAAQLERAITTRTRAVIPVHLYGHCADMDPILEIARRKKLVLIEDACQAHGAEYKGRRAGSMGDMGCFSFYPGKNLGAYGEGGLVTTNNAEHDRKLRMLRDWGAERKYQHLLQGYNYRMDGLQGAILRVKLRHLEQWTESRRSHAARYHSLLSGCGVHRPQAASWARHVYHIFAVRSSARDRLQRALQQREVQTGIHYPIPVHLQPAYASTRHPAGSFPESEAAAREVLSLPMYSELSDPQIEAVCDAVRELAPLAV